MKTFLEEHTEAIVEDRLGGVFGVLNQGSKGPRVMVAGHMDEVGGLVTGIEKSGLVKMTNLGGVHGNVFLSQHVDIITDDGERIPGVTASKPPHLLRGTGDTPKDIEFKDLKVDIGADSDEHAKELGVKIGQQIIARNDYTISKDGKKIFSKAWDDRFGCGMALEIARDLKDEDLPCELYTGATVQEEVGLRGAKTASGKIKPDVFLAIDCSPCADSFGGDEISGKLGEGFLVRFYDPSAIMHQGMKQFIVDLAEEEGVKYQYYKSMGGTDAARVQLQNGGTLVATIGMPARYIHSTTSMIHTDDYEQVKAIVKAIVKRLDWETVERIKANV
jgi:putative aminopeptidase FrvX